jgi:hypothetical protein
MDWQLYIQISGFNLGPCFPSSRILAVPRQNTIWPKRGTSFDPSVSIESDFELGKGS